MRHHDILLSIISDRGEQFIYRFRRSFQKELGTKVKRRTTFHLQRDGQEEQSIQTIEDMLRAVIIDFNGNWDTNLPLVEFSYNSSYHPRIFISNFEVLYGRKSGSPTGRVEVSESQLLGFRITL